MLEVIDLIKMISRRSSSRCGLWFSGFYIFVIGTSCIVALTSHSADLSLSVFVLLLPLAAQLSATGAINLYPVMDDLPSMVVHGLVLATGIFCFYVAGSVTGSLASRLCLIYKRATYPTAGAVGLGRWGEQAGESIA